MFGDWFRGNKTPEQRLRQAEARVEDLEFQLAMANVALAQAQAEVKTFRELHEPNYSQQSGGGFGGLF